MHEQGSEPVVLTVGHSTRPLAEFIGVDCRRAHRLTSFAQVDGTAITYPVESPQTLV
jgi:hypothetical protein